MTFDPRQVCCGRGCCSDVSGGDAGVRDARQGLPDAACPGRLLMVRILIVSIASTCTYNVYVQIATSIVVVSYSGKFSQRFVGMSWVKICRFNFRKGGST